MKSQKRRTKLFTERKKGQKRTSKKEKRKAKERKQNKNMKITHRKIKIKHRKDGQNYLQKERKKNVEIPNNY